MKMRALALALLALAASAGALPSPFVWDDTFYIAENPIVKDTGYLLSPSSAMDHPEHYRSFILRYFGFASFALQFEVHGLDVRWYHGVNIALHIASVLLLYMLILALYRTDRLAPLKGEGKGAAFLASALFAAHPLGTEAVAYLFQRPSLMAACLGLCSALLHMKARETGQRAYHILSVAAMALAMFCKENAFLYPLLIASLDLALFKESPKKRALRLAPLLLTMLIIPVELLRLSDFIESSPTGAVANYTRAEYLLSQPAVILHYMRLLLLPVGQSLFHGHTVPASWSEPAFLVPALVLVGLLSLTAYLLRKGQPRYILAGLGLSWFFIALLLESGPFPLPMLMAEYRAYMPSAGIFLAAGALYAPYMTRKPVFFGAFAALILGLLLWGSMERTSLWADPVALWEDAAGKNPASAEVRNNLGLAYRGSGRQEEALREFSSVVELAPGYAEPRLNLALLYMDQGRDAEAVDLLSEALRINPKNARAFNNLGNLYDRLGDPGAAEEAYLQALALWPSFATAHSNLGVMLARRGQSREAEAHLRRALQLAPEAAEAHFNLAVLLMTLGRTSEARAEAGEALRLAPADPDVLSLVEALSSTHPPVP